MVSNLGCTPTRKLNSLFRLNEVSLFQPFVLKEAGLYSRRIDQRLRTHLVMEQHGSGKSPAPTQYDILREPRYKTRWMKT